MGIYDRGYYRDEPGGPGGAGRYHFKGLSAWSVTTWVIVINVAIFAFDALMSRHGLPVYRGDVALVELDRMPPPPRREVVGPFYTLDEFGRASPVEPRLVGTRVYRTVVEKETNRPVARQQYRVQPPLEALGHFSTFLGFRRLEVWRLVTFQFLHSHDSIWHIALNMFGLYMFGSLVEEQLGRKRYLAFYLVCGIFGGISYLVLNLLGAGFHVNVPGVLFGDVRTPLIGASAGVFGVIMACAKIAPNMPVYLLFLPVSFRMKWVAYAWVGLAAVNLLFGGSNAGGDAAHLGGAIAGAYFIRHSHLLLDFFDVFGDSRKQKRPGPARPAGPSRRERAADRDDASIDAILAKVKEHGLQSLTAREKKMLARDTERRRRESGS